MQTNLPINRLNASTLVALLTLSTINSQLSTAHAQGTAFTYQGRLNANGNPANGSYDLSFSLYTVSDGGAVAEGPVSTNNVIVASGLFTVTLDFGDVFYSGESYWLDISVRTNGNGAFTELSPRQPLTPTPYSIHSESAANATLANGVVGGVIGPNAFQVGVGPTPGQVLSYNGSILAWTNGGGGGGGGGSGWSLTGNSGTTPGTDFLGTTDNEPLEMWVNGARVFRLEPLGNVVGGHNSSVDPSVSGATIAGGNNNIVGASGGNAPTIGGGFQNTVSNLYPTVSGGEFNMASANGASIGGGFQNTASGRESTVAGGAQNMASGAGSFVGGGGYDGTTQAGNEATGAASTVGGGMENLGLGDYSGVLGGFNNNASGNYSMAVGGSLNVASGVSSFAAGHQAHAAHDGAFVWADSVGGAFFSTAPDQFSVRADNGVRIVTGYGNGLQGLTLDGYQVLTTASGGGGGGGGGPTNVWLLGGNTRANPALGNFLGTADTNGLELRVSSLRGMRLDYALDTQGINTFKSINVNGGYWGNMIADGVTGAAIAGGGDVLSYDVHGLVVVVESNSVTGNFGAVGGGHANAAGYEATVPGGGHNSATGTGSFAAGRYASTVYDGNFVWGDGTQFAVGTGSNRFDVLATGGANFFTAGAETSINSLGNVTFGARLGQLLDLYNNGPYDYGIGVQNATFYQRTGVLGGFAWYEGGSHSDTPNSPGLNGSTLMTLDAGGNLTLALGGALNASSAYISNNMSACSITIRGGCDLAEPFAMADKEVPQGSVVVIDEENPGHLRMSDRPYDTRVAGIISGANGIHPGIQMQQQGLLEGGQDVALSGRVYVLADASNGAIKPGDLLTTSSTPGHAMKVPDHAKAQGAILGKAMTSLKEGKGMVLVLVTLQ